MPDILHRVGIKSSVDETYKALTTREGLAAWWTNPQRKGIPKSAECSNSALAPAAST
jgi:uncharacterized protein YndB with AHSA1/START domain